MNCLRLQHIVLFFSMCAVIFCGWNLFGHHVFLPAIAIMSSQQIRILQSSNLYWCRNSRIHEGILVCPARHPLLHAAIDKVMKKRPSSLRSRQHEYMTSYQQMWKLLQSRSKASSKLVRMNLAIEGRCAYYKGKTQNIVANKYAMNQFRMMDSWLI